MLSQNLSQKTLHKLSPQQIQLMKLLQVPTASLEQRIKEELEKNPALEEGESQEDIDDEFGELENPEEEEYESADDELDLDEYGLDDDYDSGYSGRSQSDDDDKTIPFAVSRSFHESLYEQLSFLDLDEDEYIIANQIVGSIDDDGYIRREIDAIMDDLAFSLGLTVTEDQVLHVLKQIQTF